MRFSKRALLTTLIQLPPMLWQHMLIMMYIRHTRRVSYDDPLSVALLAGMVLSTFFVALKTDFINKHRFSAYGLIFLSLAAAMIFDSNPFVLIALFLCYLLLTVWLDQTQKPVTAYRAVAYNKDHTVAKQKPYKRYKNVEEAQKELSDDLHKALHTFAKEAADINALKQRFVASTYDIRIYDPDNGAIIWSALWYVEQHAQKIYEHYHPSKSKSTPQPSALDALIAQGRAANEAVSLPAWFKIKHDLYEDVDITQNRADTLISLTKTQFLRLFSEASTGLFFTYLHTLNETEQERFYSYLETTVKKMPLIDDTDARTWFADAFKLTQDEAIDDEQKARATLEMPLLVSHIRHIDAQAKSLDRYVRTITQSTHETDKAISDIEPALLKTLFLHTLHDIPGTVETRLQRFKDLYNAQHPTHRNIAHHLARNYGMLFYTLRPVMQGEGKDEATAWFLESFEESVNAADKQGKTCDERLVASLAYLYASILRQDEKDYLYALLDTAHDVMRFYPLNHGALLFVLGELLKNIASADLDIGTANAVLSLFENLPRFYDTLSYDKVTELKALIAYHISESNPLDHPIFNDAHAKPKMILLHYLTDTEDMHYQALKEARAPKRAKRDTLFLAEYIAQFEPLWGQSDLEAVGLWMQPVIIDPSWKPDTEATIDKTSARIGWRVPTNANAMDFKRFLPILFRLKEGGYVTLAVETELVELYRQAAI